MANQTKLRAFLIYNKSGKLVSGPILRTQKPKDHRTFYEIPLNKCCDEPALVPMFETPGRLMAFVKYDTTGRVVPYSAVKRTHKPKDVNPYWTQVPIDLCCAFNTTTTSSTTTTTTTVATTTSSTTTTTTTV